MSAREWRSTWEKQWYSYHSKLRIILVADATYQGILMLRGELPLRELEQPREKSLQPQENPVAPARMHPGYAPSEFH